MHSPAAFAATNSCDEAQYDTSIRLLTVVPKVRMS
jgi:hypothetical protein